MQSGSTSIAAFFIVAVVFSATAEAQTQTPSCAASLASCVDDLNTTTTPQAACCSAIRTAVNTQLPCLCNLYNTPGLLTSFHINSTQALDLPRRCNPDTTDTNLCAAAAPGATNPGRPGGNNGGGGGDGNGVGTISWSAMPALILLWAATYLF